MPWSWILKLRSPNQNTSLGRERRTEEGGWTAKESSWWIKKGELMCDCRDWIHEEQSGAETELNEGYRSPLESVIFITSVWVTWSLYSLCICSPVVNNPLSLFTVKGLWVHDVLELIHSLCGVFHMCSQVTVEETERVAVERQTDSHAAFVTLRDKQEEMSDRGTTDSVKLLCSVFQL